MLPLARLKVATFDIGTYAPPAVVGIEVTRGRSSDSKPEWQGAEPDMSGKSRVISARTGPKRLVTADRRLARRGRKPRRWPQVSMSIGRQATDDRRHDERNDAR